MRLVKKGRWLKDLERILDELEEAYAPGEKTLTRALGDSSVGDGLAVFIAHELHDVCLPKSTPRKKMLVEAGLAVATAIDQLRRVEIKLDKLFNDEIKKEMNEN